MKTLAKIFSFFLLLFGSGLCRCTCKLEDIIKESIRHEIKQPVFLLKKQLLDNNHMEEDSSDVLFGLMEREPVEPRDEVSNDISSPFVDIAKEATTMLTELKDTEDFDSSTTVDKRSIEGSTTTPPHPIFPVTTSTETSIHASMERFFEMNETEARTSNDLKEVCPYYKNIPTLDINKMADVWQLIYYKSHEPLHCFKIYLKRTTPEIRLSYRRKFTTFNDTIDWMECKLELTSTGKEANDRKHFLQGTQNDKGILENMVLSEELENETNTLQITLQEQSPAQWLVTKNLLIMRDCENGDVVVFSRIPSQPLMIDIEQAMKSFGEDGMNSIFGCINDNDNEADSKKYTILS